VAGLLACWPLLFASVWPSLFFSLFFFCSSSSHIRFSSPSLVPCLCVLVLFFSLSLSLSHRHHHLLLLLLPPPFYLFYLFNSVHVLFPSLSSLYTLISGAQGNSLLHQCLLDGNQEGARFLIEHGARLDEDNHEGDMPLHFAIRARFAEIVKLLLQKGSPVNHQGRNGECPLHTAATQSDADLIDILLAEPNVDLALRNYQGHTPFWWVVIGLFVVCWLFVCLFVCLFLCACMI
jgi:Ankyrin repeats (3 copies)